MQFIRQVISDLGPPKECRHLLKPIKLPNLYEVDPTFFRPAQSTKNIRSKNLTGMEGNEERKKW